MPPVDDHVWLTREEYNQLQARAGNPAAAPVVSVVSPSPQHTPLIGQTTIVGLLGVLFVLALTLPAFRLLIIPIIAFFLVYAIVTGIRSGRQRAVANNTATAPAQHKRAKLALTIIGIILFAPLAFLGLMVIITIILVAGSGV